MGRRIGGAALVALVAALGCGGEVAGAPDGATLPADAAPPLDGGSDAPGAPACRPPGQLEGPWQWARAGAPNAIGVVLGTQDLLAVDGSGPLARLLVGSADGRDWCQVPTPRVPRQIFRQRDSSRWLMTSLDEAAGGVRLHRTEDRGETWQRLELLLPAEPAGVFALPGAQPILVVTFPAADSPAEDVLISLDDGATFQTRTVTVAGAPGPPLRWRSVRRDPREPAGLLAVVTFERPDPGAPEGATVEIPALIASTDSGETWRLVEVPNAERLADLVVSEQGALTAVTFEREVWTRDPRATQWRQTGSLPDLRARRLWADVEEGTFYLTGLSPGPPAGRRLLKSLDAGATWSTLVEAAFDEEIVPGGAGHLLGLSDSGLRVSRDDARSWSLGVFQTGNQNVVATGPADAAVLYLVSHQSILRSTDAGRTWQGRLLEGQRLLDLVPDPGDRDGLFAILTAPGAAGAPWRLYRSQDGGESWTAIDLGTSLTAEQSVHAVLALATEPPSLLVSTDAGVLRSEDGGATWALVLAGRPGFLRAAPSAPATVLAASDALVHSHDGGKTWTAVPSIAPPIDAGFHPGNADLVYLAGPSGFRALSLSRPWRQLGSNAEIPFEASGAIPPPRMVAATPSGGVHVIDRLRRLWHSPDEGVTWERADSTPGVAFQSLAIDPARPEALFLSTDSGLLRSRFE